MSPPSPLRVPPSLAGRATPAHPVVAAITGRIAERSAHSRADYLALVDVVAPCQAPPACQPRLRQPGPRLRRVRRAEAKAERHGCVGGSCLTPKFALET